MTNELNTQIERNTSHTITLQTSSDLSGWTLIYLAKNKVTDKDVDAVLNITPTIVETDGVKNIVVSFLPSHTKNLEVGYLRHSFRAISADKKTVLVLFNGTLRITQEGIEAPL